MAFNPSPKVTAARDIARRFNKCQVIVLMIGEHGVNGRTLEYASFGESVQECAEAKQLADVAFEAVMKELTGSQ